MDTTCSVCGHKNESGAKYCARCGVQLQQQLQNLLNGDMTDNDYEADTPDARDSVSDFISAASPSRSADPLISANTAGRSNSTGITATAPSRNTAETDGAAGIQNTAETSAASRRRNPAAATGTSTGRNSADAPSASGHRNSARNARNTETRKSLASTLNLLEIFSRFSLKQILIFGIPALAVIIALLLFVVPRLRNTGGGILKSHIEFIADRGELVISADNSAKFSISGELHSYQLSIDGSKAVALTDFSNRNGGILWFVAATGATRIADDVFAYQLADSGDGVVYFTDYHSDDYYALLYLYDTSSKKATHITDDAYYDGSGAMPGVSISPNGKSIGYVTDYDIRNYEFTGYIRIDGKNPEKLGDETYAVAISNGGRHIYYCRMDMRNNQASFHIRTARDDNRLAPNTNSISIILNADYSEIIYTVRDYTVREDSDERQEELRTYISRNGSERERIRDFVIRSLLTPQGTPTRAYKNVFSDITVVGLSSFSSFVAVTDSGLAYVSVSNNLFSNAIPGSTGNVSRAQISSDGKTLYYINNSNRLSSIDPTVAGAERNEIARNVYSFTLSGDGRSIYYVNDDAELYHVRSNGSQTKVADDVQYDRIVASSSGNRVFFLVEYSYDRGGELCYSNNGSRRAKVAGADDVLRLWSTPTNIFYLTRDQELYRSNGDERFTRFHDLYLE